MADPTLDQLFIDVENKLAALNQARLETAQSNAALLQAQALANTKSTAEQAAHDALSVSIETIKAAFAAALNPTP